MKRILSLFICVVMMASLFSGCLIKKKDGVALTVGETELTADEFAYYVYMCKSQLVQEKGVDISDDAAVEEFLKAKDGDLTNAEIICNNAIEEVTKMLVQYNKAIEMGLDLTEDENAECVNYINSMKTQMGGTTAYEQQLKELGTTADAFEKLYRKNFVAGKLYDHLIADGTIAASEEETAEYIKTNYIKAAHILFSTQDATTGMAYDEATVASKKQLAEETLAKINAGEDFTTLMNELSEDPGLETAPTGYVFGKGEMVPQFEEAAFALGENEVSGIVETSYGLHIIKRLPLEVDEESIAQYSSNATTALQTDKIDALTEEWKAGYKITTNEKEMKKFK